MAGQPGTLHYNLFSFSNLPSMIPIVSLDIGDGFSDLCAGPVEVIPPEGYIVIKAPLTITVELTIYLQTVVFGLGTPLPVSNVQSVVLTPPGRTLIRRVGNNASRAELADGAIYNGARLTRR